MRNSTIALLALASAMAGGCAQHAKYTVDDVALAQVPLADKQAIFAAEQEIAVAKAEKAKAEADVDTTKHDIGFADAERGQAKLEVDKAKLEQEAADKSQNLNRRQSADKLRDLADLGYKVADAKVDMLGAKKKWQKELVDVADEKVGAAMARMEAEKAKLAAAKNIKPTPDFDPAVFTAECTRRQKRVDSEQLDADEKKVEMDKAAATYRDLKVQFDQRKSGSVTAK
jgi:hypothetical protein